MCTDLLLSFNGWFLLFFLFHLPYFLLNLSCKCCRNLLFLLLLQWRTRMVKVQSVSAILSLPYSILLQEEAIKCLMSSPNSLLLTSYDGLLYSSIQSISFPNKGRPNERSERNIVTRLSSTLSYYSFFSGLFCLCRESWIEWTFFPLHTIPLWEGWDIGQWVRLSSFGHKRGYEWAGWSIVPLWR